MMVIYGGINMSSIYNTIDEIKLRILLILENDINRYMTLDEIVAFDFITIYAS